MSKISVERLKKIFSKGDLNEQMEAVSEIKKFVAENHEEERKKLELQMQKITLHINEINGNA